MVGLRGVGKTVLLDRMRENAEAVGIHTLRVEAPETRSLPAILAPQLRQALLRLSRNEKARDFAQRALRGLAGFAKALKVKYADIEVGFDFEPEPGLADNGDLEHDLQEWGKHAWDIATESPITVRDVEIASTAAIAALDESFFRVRFDRLTPLEKRYLRAMAELGPGPHRSGDIADELGRDVTALGPTRNQLISKGMIWSPSHGDTAFTVPLFDEFMHRIVPGDDWRLG